MARDVDPPSIHDLFVYYDQVYFGDRLSERVFVEWSSDRMTSCGGTCSYKQGAVVIRLSKPLLTLRPFHETQDVLLHEMIHAEHFVKGIRDDDPTGHGTLFKSKMRAINEWKGYDMYRPMQGYNITVTHSMIDEVNYYRKHCWACQNCGDLVRRSGNRAPQKADCRKYRKGGEDVECGDMRCMWHMHKKYCGGLYVKIGGDEDKAEKISQPKNKKKKTALDTWLEDNALKKRTSKESVVDLTETPPEVIDLT
jgi:hypothetical protein